MRNREQIEDTIQRIVCELLPKMPPQDIRPAYQEHDIASKVIFTDGADGSGVQTTGFTPDDNFIYITARIGPETSITSINSSGEISTGFAIETTFTFYGSQSSQLSLCLFSLLEIEHALSSFESFGMYLHKKDNEIAEMREIINEQWFERHEFSVVFLVSENIRSPFTQKEAMSGSIDIKTIVSHGDTVQESAIMKRTK